jgi:uncharacterized protein (TIGR02145 family)
MNKHKILSLTASMLLAVTFIFSCSSDDSDGGGGVVSSSSVSDGWSSSSEGTQGRVSSSSDGGEENSQSYSYCVISENEICLGGPFTLKDCNSIGGLPSNSCPYGGVEPSSSSGETASSSSEAESSSDSQPSSSVGGGSSSSSSIVQSSSSNNAGTSSSSRSNFDRGIFIDPRDGKEYKFEVSLTGQLWMSENLNYSRNNTLGYCFGVDIDGTNPHQDASGCDNGYGRIYEWSVAMDGNSPQGLCPDGWHIPTESEWSSITDNPTYCGSINMSNNFCISAGNYNTNSQYPPLGWKERNYSGFYWTSSGYAYFTGLWHCSPTSNPSSDGCMDIQSSGTLDDYFSVRCVNNTSYIIHDIYDSLTYGGQTYQTVKIGSQTWFAENLNYDPGSGIFISCDTYNCDTYGRLYDWSTAMGLPPSCNSTSCSNQIQSPHRGICPSGWHIPNDDDWNILINYSDPSTVSLDLKAKSGWDSGDNGTNRLGFSALPGGYGYSDGRFYYVSHSGYWWSASEYNSDNAYGRSISGSVNEVNEAKSGLFSIRCLQD